MKILLINDNSALPNWGAQATTHCLLRVLWSIPGAETAAIPHEWLTRLHRMVRIPGLRSSSIVRNDALGFAGPIVRRVSTPIDFFPQVADDFDFWADEWLAGRGGPQAAEFLSMARDADIVVYNGENSIYRNTGEGRHGLFLMWIAKTRLQKPTCIVNHTAHLDEVLPVMPAIVKLVYPELDLVAVREPRSLDNLKDHGIRNAVLFPDIVFAHDPDTTDSEPVDRWRREVGLGDDPYFCLSGSGLLMSMARPTWDGEVAELVRALQTLVPRAVLMAKDPWCAGLEEVARRTGAAFFGPEHGFPELWPLLERASFLVTGHFHYAIMGAMVGCPFVPLSVNNHKMQGVCEHLGWHLTEPFDATSLATCRNGIVNEVRRLLDERPEMSSQLAVRSAEMRTEVWGLAERIAELGRGAIRGEGPGPKTTT